MLRSSLWDYSDAYILLKGTITAALPTAAAPINANKKIIAQNCSQFTNCIRRINNMHVDNAHDIDVVMPMYNLIESSDNYLKSSGILWQYYRDELALAANAITDFNADNATTNNR